MSGFSHASLADGRWDALPLAKQMGNIGSEISRAIRWRGKENPERMEACVERALELIDLSLRWAQTAEIRKAHPGALRELARLRAVVCDYFLDENEYASEETALLRYFDQFALASA